MTQPDLLGLEANVSTTVTTNEPAITVPEGRIVTVEEVLAAANRGKYYQSGFYYRGGAETFVPWWGAEKPDQWATWEAMIAAGKSYLMGKNVDTNVFIQQHRSFMSSWQQLAFFFCKANPLQQLVMRNRRFAYKVYWRGEYCTISLPHQDLGGERDWVSRDGKTKVLINVD